MLRDATRAWRGGVGVTQGLVDGMKATMDVRLQSIGHRECGAAVDPSGEGAPRGLAGWLGAQVDKDGRVTKAEFHDLLHGEEL